MNFSKLEIVRQIKIDKSHSTVFINDDKCVLCWDNEMRLEEKKCMKAKKPHPKDATFSIIQLHTNCTSLAALQLQSQFRKHDLA